MGLGKTLQILYFIEWHAQQNNHSKPYLIVAPVTLIENWENEYIKFFTLRSLQLIKLYGTTELKKEYNKQNIDFLQKQQIILTNYETLRAYQFNLCAVDYAVVALDEAQKIKTPGTLIEYACKLLKSDFKIAMTGTPVENTLIDLWCIMDFSVPGLLGCAKDFAKKFQSPLKEEKTDIVKLGEKLRDGIGIFIKRRLKQDVAKDLPIKYDNENSRIKKQMPEIQLERYKIEIELAKNSNLQEKNKRNQVLKSLWAIRAISDHPFLVDSQILNFSSSELIASSAKLQILIDILLEVKNKDEKAIVFADRKDTQKMLQKVIYDIFSIFPSIVNGDTPTIKKAKETNNLSRQQTIDRYQEEIGFNIIILSPLAAGIGLNVTKANHIIHFTRHWNPAKEEQATDRAYRIGQNKNVHVYYPMAVFPESMINEDGNKQKSFDETLDILLARKKSLATSTLFPTEQAEVKPDEIFADIFGINSTNNPTPLNINQIDQLQPNLFEAYIAALYSKQEYQTSLTPFSNDKGVDVVAIKEGENYLVQVKQSKSTIGISCVQEIVAAKKYYESRYKESFQLVVISNSNFTAQTETLSNINHVNLINRKELELLISKIDISIQDINKNETQRMAYI